jgi:hypothetical protein
MMKRLIPVVILVAFLAVACPPVFAEEKTAKPPAENLPWSKYGIMAGAFASSTNSEIRFSANGIGLGIDVEEALGLDTSSTVFRLGGFWRFSDNRRHRADLSYFGLRRDGDTNLTQDITIDGIVLPTGTYVNTSLDMDVYKAAYSYSFLQDDRVDIAASVGLYIMPISFELNATGLLTTKVSETFTAPLPVLGLRADFALTPKWFLRSHFDVFYLEYQKFKGAIYSSSVGVEYKAFKNVGFGLAADSFNLVVEAEGEDFPGLDLTGKIEYRYLGGLLYAKYYF